MKSFRIFAATMLAVGALVATALPAAANNVGTAVVFDGTAEVGCPLFFPNGAINPSTCTNGTTTFNDGWEFFANTIVAVEDGAPVTVSFHAHGKLAAAASTNVVLGNLGPWCGLSKGYGGVGEATSSGKFSTVALSEIGWVTSAGSILPTVGRWEHSSGANGTIVALVDAIGGQPCAGAGATDFDVIGVSALV